MELYKLRPIVIKYPPDFDGELRIEVQAPSHLLQDPGFYTFTVTVAREAHDSPRGTLKRVARDIIDFMRGELVQ